MSYIAVGGLGGSGTRTIAGILEALGVFLGSDLNESKDDLSFTLVFKPLHRRTSTLDQVMRSARPRLDLYTKLLFREPLTVRDHLLLAAATSSVALRGHDHLGTGRGRWALARRSAMLASSTPDRRTFTAWGWKEPNTHVFLPVLLDRYPDLRYVHLVRHGLDMVFSSNDTQFRIWGRHFGVPAPPDGDLVPVYRLRYWSAANIRVSEAAKRHPDRCLVVRFEDVCRDPRGTCRTIGEFCGIPCDPEALDRSEALVRPPESLGRFTEHDLSSFERADLDALRTFGYDTAGRHR